MTEERLLSNSEIETYQDCPRRWWLQYVEGWLPRQEKGYLAFGTHVHTLLEEYYKNDVLPEFDEKDMASIMLHGYDEWVIEEQLDYGREVEALEIHLSGFGYRGKADLLQKEGDQYVLVDFKTAGDLKALSRRGNLNPQMRTYAWLAREMGYPIKQCELRILKKSMRKSKVTDDEPLLEDYYHNHVVEISDAILDVHATNLATLKKDIDLQVNREFEAMIPRFSNSCTWCDYSDQCEMYENNQDSWRESLPLTLIQKDPNERYKK